MKTDKYGNMKILEKNGKFKLEYIYKISKRTVKRKNKGQTINTFYAAYLPEEIYSYFDVKDRTIFFYEYEDTIRITSRRPSIEHREIKVQKSNQFSIPRDYFNPKEAEQVKLTLDLNKVDNYKNGLGVLTMELI